MTGTPGRGYPDISANGATFPTYVNQTLQHYYGTSLSTPLWAAVITLINTERQAVGKGPVASSTRSCTSMPSTY